MPKDGKIEFDGTYRTDSYNKVLSANQRIARRDKKKSGSRFLCFPIQYPDPIKYPAKIMYPKEAK